MHFGLRPDWLITKDGGEAFTYARWKAAAPREGGHGNGVKRTRFV